MENAPADPPDADPSPPPVVRSAAPGREFGARVARWGMELATVFVGVYAAFMLNGYQNRHQEAQRRAQILNWMESVYREQAEGVVRETADLKKHADEFNRALDAGEMPTLHAFEWRSDYSPTDIPGILQNGGYDLLEIETIRAIREADAVLRRMVVLLAHDQQLSDAQILPNLGRGPEVFYDPATRQLRPPFQWYPRFFKTELNDYADLKAQTDKALDCIRRERVRHRL